MNDQDAQQNHSSNSLDKELENRFAHLRKSERSGIPAFPSELTLQSRAAIASQKDSAKPAFYQYMPQMAAALATVTLISVFLTNTRENALQEDPAEIYTSIMQTHEQMATDHLLIVSESLLPELTVAPEFYDIALDLEPELYTN